MGTRRATSSRRPLFTLTVLEMAGDLLHGDEADAFLPAGVEGPVERGVLVEPGGVLEHDRVNGPPLGGGLNDLGPVLVMGRDADQASLARLADGVGRFLELAALHEADRLVERVVVSEAVNEEEVEVVGSHRGQALLELAHDLAGRARQVFGDHEDFLANLGRLLEPELEVGLGLVFLGSVEAANALGVGELENPLDSLPPTRSGVENRDIDSRLAQGPPGNRQGLRGVVRGLAQRVGRRTQADGRSRGHGGSLKERAAIGRV